MQNNLINQLKLPPEPHPLLKKYWEFKWWLEEKFYQYAPKWVRTTYYKIKDFYYKQISCRLFPRNKSLNKAIPRTYEDLDSLITNFLFACVIRYVEEEECFETIVWTDTRTKKRQAAMIKEIYNYIKIKRPELEQKSLDAMPKKPANMNMEDWINSDSADYKKCWEINDEIEKLDNKYSIWVTKNRGILWT